MIFKIFTISFLLCNIAIAGNPAYTDFDTRSNPAANSYQSKRDTPQKYLVSEERQGHLNRTKKAYKGTYHEKESMIPGIVMESPECFVHGPDTLSIGEPGVYHSRTVNSYDSFDLQTAWDISTPANMSYDQRVIDIAKPFEFKYGTSSSPGDDVVRWSTPNATKYSTTDLVTRWSTPGGSQWDSDEGKTRWEGQRDTAENTGKEEGFCRAEYTFNHSGVVRIDTTPIIPGMDKVVKCASKFVYVMSISTIRQTWSDNFDDNSVDTTKWWGGNPFYPPFGGFGSYLDVEEKDQHVNFVGNDPMGGMVNHWDNRIWSRCPASWFTSDFTISVDFSDFNSWICASSGSISCLGVYLMYEYGSGSDDWLSIEFNYYCNYDDSTWRVSYRWGYCEYSPYVDHFTYSTWISANLPESGQLKMRRRGSLLQFWNDIDSQWESMAFPATTTTSPVKVGVWSCWASNFVPTEVNIDNFLITED